jgi:putative hydrolase of the HAD superfamily
MSWVMFDFGGVIGKYQPEEDVAALAAAAGVSVAQFRDAYWAPRFAYDISALTVTAFWQDVAGRLGRSFTDTQVGELLRLDIASWMHLCDGTVRLIHDLESAGRRLALLSNQPAENARAIAEIPLARHFEHLFFSCDLKAGKPDPGCFSQALDRLGAAAEEVILIDDNEENVRVATRMGMQTIRFTGPEQARAGLAGILGMDRLLSLLAPTGPGWMLAEQKLSVRSQTCWRV